MIIHGDESPVGWFLDIPIVGFITFLANCRYFGLNYGNYKQVIEIG